MAKDLPKDLISNVLHRLRAKSLLRFRCVSRSWCSIIDDPLFVRSHLHRDFNFIVHGHHKKLRQMQMFTMYLCPHDNIVGDHILPLKDHEFILDSMTLRGSSNGLVCLADQGNVIICNLSTRVFHNVKLPSEYTIDKFWFSYGFGYDSINDDYKVVRVDRRRCQEISGYENTVVYSLRKDSWDRPQTNLPSFFHRSSISNEDPVLVSGALHWTIWGDNKDKPFLVFAFDLATEEFGKIDLPVKTDRPPAMGVLGGCLTMTCSCTDVEYDIELWVMKDYMVQESWTKLFRTSAVGYDGDLRPITYSRDGNKILMLSPSDCFFYWYHVESQVLVYVDIRGYSGLAIAPYSESLVSVSAYRGCNKRLRTAKETILGCDLGNKKIKF
ncbi:hypothetical protein SLA2020_346970 [Shorea laevis]